MTAADRASDIVEHVKQITPLTHNEESDLLVYIYKHIVAAQMDNHFNTKLSGASQEGDQHEKE